MLLCVYDCDIKLNATPDLTIFCKVCLKICEPFFMNIGRKLAENLQGYLGPEAISLSVLFTCPAKSLALHFVRRGY